MKFKLTLIFGLFLLCSLTYGQSSRLRIIVLDKKTKQAVGNREMVLTINDTLTKTIKLNVDGEAAPIRIEGGYYNLKIAIDQYETKVLKKVGIYEFKGRILIVKLNPVKNNN
jgi:hypothetical protein